MIKASEILDALDPQEQRKLKVELAEALSDELKALAEDEKDDALFEKLAREVIELQKKRQARKNAMSSQPTPDNSEKGSEKSE